MTEENLLGREGKGCRTLVDGMNAERILIAAKCIGDGYWFIDRATKYANERVVLGRKISQNQGEQFPIAEALIELDVAHLMRWKACERIDALPELHPHDLQSCCGAPPRIAEVALSGALTVMRLSASTIMSWAQLDPKPCPRCHLDWADAGESRTDK